MPTNYCPYCGRFMMMKDFEHACDQTNKIQNMKDWCSRCGAKLNPVTDNTDEGLCSTCMK